ncbi:MAG: 50S ribosomal protein L11 methyltransferase [Methylohalobius sp.]|nr:50S ribosomal protein L11 methyltransferase [Methylohalobius sp.]
MPWQEFCLVLPRELAVTACEFLEAKGAQAVTFSEGGGEELFEPPPGEAPLWLETRLTALFDQGVEFEALAADLADYLGIQPTWESKVLTDQPWERIWLEHFRPMRFNRLYVCPSGQSLSDPESVGLILDPGLAFGTGTHPTTALCLKWLSNQNVSAKTVIDYGCGSGILAIAALLLGAKQAIACDIDPQALMATRENARKNQVTERLTCCYPEAMPAIVGDFVLANIVADPLIALAPTLTAFTRPGGWLVLSGILESQIQSVEQAYAKEFDFQSPMREDGWACLTGVRRV